MHLKLAARVFFEMSEGPIFISVEGGGKNMLEIKISKSPPPPPTSSSHVNSKRPSSFIKNLRDDPPLSLSPHISFHLAINY